MIFHRHVWEFLRNSWFFAENGKKFYYCRGCKQTGKVTNGKIIPLR